MESTPSATTAPGGEAVPEAVLAPSGEGTGIEEAPAEETRAGEEAGSEGPRAGGGPAEAAEPAPGAVGIVPITPVAIPVGAAPRIAPAAPARASGAHVFSRVRVLTPGATRVGAGLPAGATATGRRPGAPVGPPPPSAPPPPTVEQLLVRLRALAAARPPGDGLAVFSRMYLTVSEDVREHLRLLGYFADPAAARELMTVFAAQFLTAVDEDAEGRPAPACWRPLLELRRHPGVHPLQFALAGMNAHIEHDLPLAVVETCERLSCAPHQLAADFHRINDILAEVEERVRERLHPCAADPGAAGPGPAERRPDVCDPLLHLVTTWSVDRARDAAWASAHALWELRGSPAAFHALASSLDDSVGLVSRCLLTPLGHG